MSRLRFAAGMSKEGGKRKRPGHSSSRQPPGAGSGPKRSISAQWVVLLVAVNLCLGMAYSVVTLRHSADRYRDAELVLSRLQGEATSQKGLVTRANESGPATTGLAGHLQRAASIIGREAAALRSVEAELPAQTFQSLSAYRTALGEAARAAEAGLELGSESIAELRASNEDVLAAAGAAAAEVRRTAESTSRTADFESIFMMAFVAVMGAVVFRRFERARVQGEVRAARERAASEARLRSLVRSSSDVITVVDSRGLITYQSPSVTRMLGHDPSRLTGERIADVLHPDDGQSMLAVIDGMARGEDVVPILEGRWRDDNGDFRFVESVLTNLLDDADVRGIVINGRDVTDSKAAARALQESSEALQEREERLRFLVDHVPVVVYRAESGKHGRWHYVSPQIESLLGYTPEEWQADRTLWLRHLHPDDRDAVLCEEGVASESGGSRSIPIEYRMLTRAGRTIWVSDSATAVVGKDGRKHWSGVLVDVTERKELEEQLRHQAFHDSLTGLPNRALFANRLDHALARSRRQRSTIAVLFVDLDDFKTINDSLGHSVGDTLLRDVGTRLERCVRAGDTLARLGGDEFGLLIEDVTDGGDAVLVAKRVQEGLQEPFAVGGKEVFMRASIGIASGRSRDDGAQDLLRNADVAMYQAKRDGKGRYREFAPGMHDAVLERLELSVDLERALPRGELVLNYQPIVRLATREIVGLEALLRWAHPRRGLVVPADFIPIAEETGTIVDIGRWVLLEACHRVQGWRRELGLPEGFSASVNLSARQLQHPRLLEDVAGALASSGLPAECLTLEITESVLLAETDEAAERLAELKELGVRVAIDDFGTGYSSLSYLSRLPIDVLKIDKTFVEGLSLGSEESAIAKAVIQLCRTLRLNAVAEGIELPEQLAHLGALGCSLGQGFYFARPLDEVQAGMLLAGSGELGAASELAN